MITRSGWNRRAISIASATVPASATTWKFGRRLEHRDEALADDLVVVDDEQAQLALGWLRAASWVVVDSLDRYLTARVVVPRRARWSC